jgi:hypothetical protein
MLIACCCISRAWPWRWSCRCRYYHFHKHGLEIQQPATNISDCALMPMQPISHVVSISRTTICYTIQSDLKSIGSCSKLAADLVAAFQLRWFQPGSVVAYTIKLKPPKLKCSSQLSTSLIVISYPCKQYLMSCHTHKSQTSISIIAIS